MTQVPLPPDMPSQMRQLPRSSAGFPIPWFVPFLNNKPDFRLMEPDKLIAAIRAQLCFICGERLKRVHGSTAPRGTFVAGPMCVVNRTSAEPPNHADCAEWSAKACPFLNNPDKSRREGGIPEQARVEQGAGIPILRNPGVTALIHATKWRVYPVPAGGHDGHGNEGLLFEFLRVDAVDWVAEGHKANADQVLTSIETGLPALIELAEQELGAMPVLARRTRDTLRWLPGAEPFDYPTIMRVLAELR